MRTTSPFRLGVTFACALGVAAALVAQQRRETAPFGPAGMNYPYPVVRDMRGVVPPGPKLLPSPPLGDGPWTFQTTEADVRVSVITKGFSHPYGLAILPDGTFLITERVGALRVVRNGVIDPTPVPGVPQVIYRGTEAGLMDIILHPNFAQNRWVYFSYHKPIGNNN